MTIPAHYLRTVLTGGVVNCLDAIDGARLNDGDTCQVTAISSAISYLYRLNAASGAALKVYPGIISPDTNATSDGYS